MSSSRKKSAEKKSAPKKQADAMPLGAANYLLIALGALVIAGSYWGMYLERQVDGFFSLNIAPALLVGAYLLVGWGIMWKRRGEKRPS